MKLKLMFKTFTKHLSKSIATLLLVAVSQMFAAFEANAQGGVFQALLKMLRDL